MKNNTLTYFLTNTLFLGGGLSLIFKYANHDAYIAVILGTLLGVIILYIIHKFVINKKLSIPIIILYYIYLLSIVFIILITLSTFISSYYLTKTPSVISCIPLIILAIYSSKNITKISYVAIPLFVISISIIIFKSAILIADIKLSNIYPILSSNIYDLFKATFIYAIFSTTPSILLLNEKVEFNKSLKYYLLSSILILITTFILITTLGSLINTLSYPEYSILRRVKLLNSIENIEGILAITWIFDIFITLSICSNKIKELSNTNSYLLPFILITLIMVIINLTINSNYHNLIVIYNYHAIVLSLISFVLITFISWFGIKSND